MLHNSSGICCHVKSVFQYFAGNLEQCALECSLQSLNRARGILFHAVFPSLFELLTSPFFHPTPLPLLHGEYLYSCPQSRAAE